MKRFVHIIIWIGFFWLTQATAASITYQETRIPMPEAGSAGLEALLVWPNDNKTHPTALLNHGSPREAHKRIEMSAIAALPIAMEFARRGFAVAVVMRRGYASSGGGWAEDTGSCDNPDYLHSAFAASKDLHTVIAYLAKLPAFDTHKILAVGVSAGGFSTLALTADHPPAGLVAAISFAGGRGSKANNVVCRPDKLIVAFSELGRTSRIPTVWVYAENDHFFDPTLAHALASAFTTAGGKATLIIAPPYSEEGHFLFSNNSIATWTPYVDAFLKTQQLVLVDHLLPLPTTPPIATPNNLSATGKADFAKYLQSAPHKAFALAANGAYGWRTGQRTIALAEQQAIAFCAAHTKETCNIIATDNQLTPITKFVSLR